MTRQLQWAFQIVFFSSLAVITYLSLAPQVPGFVSGYDKANHGAAYLFLAFAADQAFPAAGILTKALGLFAYGFTMEVIQEFFMGRTFEWWDLLANATGLFLYSIARRLVLERAQGGRRPSGPGAGESGAGSRRTQ